MQLSVFLLSFISKSYQIRLFKKKGGGVYVFWSRYYFLTEVIIIILLAKLGQGHHPFGQTVTLQVIIYILFITHLFIKSLLFNQMNYFKGGFKKLRKLRRNAKPAHTTLTLNEEQDSSSNASDSDSTYEEDDDDVKTSFHEECLRQLKEEGLEDHLKSAFCNHKSESMVQTMMMRFVKLIVFLHVTVNGNVESSINTALVLQSLITDSFKMLPVYYEHLMKRVLLQASTIIAVNENIQILVHWYCIYRTSSGPALDSSSLYNINVVIKAMRKVCV